MLTKDVIKAIDNAVLCWLATTSKDLMPNVSPKEAFTHLDQESIVIANIASPKTVKNIKENPNVCISFIDILVQKGYQLKGTAIILDKQDPSFSRIEEKLLKLTKGLFPFQTITKITVKAVNPIIAPSYFLFPETTEQDQIQNAKRSYGI